MPRRKKNRTVEDQPGSKIILQENISKKKRTEPVGTRHCTVVLKDIDKNRSLQKPTAVDGAENIKTSPKCNSADADKKVINETIQGLQTVGEDKNQAQLINIVKTFTIVDGNNIRKVFARGFPQESQSRDESTTLGTSNKMSRNCDTAEEGNGKENELAQDYPLYDTDKIRRPMIQRLQKIPNPTIVAENIKDKEMPQECQSADEDGMMPELLQNFNCSTVDNLRNEMPQKSMSVVEDGKNKATPENEYVRENLRSTLRYRGSSTRGNFRKEADHDYCTLFDDYYSSDEEYMPDMDLGFFSKNKLKYEEDCEWSPPNKKSGNRKRAKKSSTTSNTSRIKSRKSDDNDKDGVEHSNILLDNSLKSSNDAAETYNNKPECGPKKNTSINFEKKKKSQHVTNESRLVHSNTYDFKTSIQSSLPHPTAIETMSVCSPKPLLQHPTIETKLDASIKPSILQAHKLEPNQETREEVQDDDDCSICFIGERKTSLEATLPNALLNKYVLHCKNHQSCNADVGLACMYCSQFLDLDAIKIFAVADLLGDPRAYVESGIQRAEAEVETVKKRWHIEKQFKLKMAETKLKILKKAKDLLLEFGSFDYYVIQSEMPGFYNL